MDYLGEGFFFLLKGISLYIGDFHSIFNSSQNNSTIVIIITNIYWVFAACVRHYSKCFMYIDSTLTALWGVTIVSSIFTDKETENKDVKRFTLDVPCAGSWHLNPCSQTPASMLVYLSRSATSISCVCFTLPKFNSHSNSCKWGVSCNWAVFVSRNRLWWWVPQCCEGAVLHIRQGACDGQTEA